MYIIYMYVTCILHYITCKLHVKVTCTCYMYVTCMLHVYYMYKLHVHYVHIHYMYITCTLHALSVTILYQYLFLTSASTGFNFFLKLPATKSFSTFFWNSRPQNPFRQCFSVPVIHLRNKMNRIESNSGDFFGSECECESNIHLRNQVNLIESNQKRAFLSQNL